MGSVSALRAGSFPSDEDVYEVFVICFISGIELKSLILAQIERWRHA